MEGDDLSVVEEAVEDGRGAGHVAQELAPVFEWSVAGHDGASGLVSAHDDLELRVSVRVLFAFDGFAVGLKAVAHSLEHFANFCATDVELLQPELSCQNQSALDR